MTLEEEERLFYCLENNNLNGSIEIMNEIKSHRNFFYGHYVDWRKSRIEKLISILGESWFNGKTILELGCGYGDIGRELQKLGSLVTFAEGKKEHVEQMKLMGRGPEIILLDQDNDWCLNRKFDLVIHWGVLYHLDNWKRDLEISIKHGKIVSLETEVIDSDDPEIESKLEECWYDGALNHVGSRMSAGNVEKVFNEIGVVFNRYDDKDLNASYHCYDWKVGERSPGIWSSGTRRFWMIYNDK